MVGLGCVAALVAAPKPVLLSSSLARGSPKSLRERPPGDF